MNTVVHFELPYENADRAAAFYGAAFGWHFQQLDAAMGTLRNRDHRDRGR